MNTSIGAKLKTIRVIKGLSRSEVAEAISLSDSAYGKIDRGESGIDIDRLKLLASFFKIPLQILTEEQPFYPLSRSDTSPVALNDAQISITNEKLVEALLKISEQLTILIEKKSKK